MNYKIYYDDMEKLVTASSSTMFDTLANLQVIIQHFVDVLNEMGGETVSSIAAYMEEVHIKSLLDPLMILPLDPLKKIKDYYEGYLTYVDPGDGVKAYYTTILSKEIDKESVIWKNLEKVRDDIVYIDAMVAKSKAKVSGTGVTLTRGISTQRFLDGIDEVKRKMTDLNNRVEYFESNQKGTLDDINEKIQMIRDFIKQREQGSGQDSIVTYVSGSIFETPESKELNRINQVTSASTIAFINSDEYNKMQDMAVAREQRIAKEERKRKTAWYGVGIAVIGTIATVAATVCLGPVGAAVVGGVVEGVKSATNDLIENYVETGSATEGMDWGKFAKGIFVNAAVGAVSSAVSAGPSSLMSPWQSAGKAIVKSALEKSTKVLANTAWNFGAVLAGNMTLDEATKDNWKVVGDSVQSFVAESFGELAGASFLTIVGVPSSATKSGKKILTDWGKGTIEKWSETSVNIIWDKIRSGDDKSWNEILRERQGEYVSSAITSGISSVWDEKVKVKTPNNLKIEKGSNYLLKGAGKMISGMVGDVTGDALGDYLKNGKIDRESFGDRQANNLRKNIIKGVQTVGNEVIKNEAPYSNNYGRNQIDKSDGCKDDQVTMIQIGDEYVTKQDYLRAEQLAGKNGYRDQSVSDVLGVKSDASSIRDVTIEKDDLGSKGSDATYTKRGKYSYGKKKK